MTESRPPLALRLLDRLRVPPLPRHQRVLWPTDDGLEAHGVDLLGQRRESALSRRLQRSNSDVVASYAAVFAAVRWREQAITRPQIVLQERVAGEWREVGSLDDPIAHPVLDGLRRINGSTTTKQGLGGIERGKLTNGDHYWIKRRDGLGTPREFEVWDGASVRAVPRKDRPWEPDHFERMRADGSREQVAPDDAIWFRHIVHPRNPMLSLTPIGAIRVSADSSLESARYQQRFFDQGMGAGGFLVPSEPGALGPAEVERIRQKLEQDFIGTDNASRWHLMEESLKLLATPQTNRDLEFVDQLKWGVIEVARAFEVSPITLKDFDKATYTNADQAAQQDWETIRNQLDATVQEFNEFLIRPDYGDDLRLVARYAGIAALQDSFKLAAEVDDIRLRSGYATINELRRRDGLDPVEWGDTPIIQVNMAPLGGESEEEQEGPPVRTLLGLIDQADREGWGRRKLKNAIRAAHGRAAPEAPAAQPQPPPGPRRTVRTVERDERGAIVAVTEEVVHA